MNPCHLKKIISDKKTAIIKTGAQRLRPVLLTTITTVLGLMPMTLMINIDFFTREIQYGSPSTQWWVQMSTAIVFGGPHAASLPIPTLRTSKANFVVKGEGEVAFPAIIECVMSKLNPEVVPGIVYDWNGWNGETKDYLRFVADKKKKNREREKQIEVEEIEGVKLRAKITNFEFGEPAVSYLKRHIFFSE